MRIGIDLDDTLTKTKEAFPKYLKKYRRVHHLKRYSSEHQVTDDDYMNFLKEYGEIVYCGLKEKRGASSILKKWALEGHELYVITARDERICPHVEEYTKRYLKNLGIVYQDIVFASSNKYEDAKKFHLDVYIDDQEKVLNTFPVKDVFLIRMVPNKNVYSKHHKVTSWKEIDKLIDTL